MSLTFKARDIASLTRDHANEIANLKKQMSLQQQQFQQLQKNQQRLSSEKSSVNSKHDSIGRNNSEDSVASISSQRMGITKPPFNPQSQSQSLSSSSNQSISLSSQSAYNSNTNGIINKSTSFNANNSVIIGMESSAVRESVSATSVDSAGNNHINQTSTSNTCVDNNPAPIVSASAASLSLLSSAAAVASLNAQVTSLPANQSTGAVVGPSIGSKSANTSSTVNNVNDDGDLTVVNILLPLYKDLMMSAALVSIREAYHFHPAITRRLYGYLKGDGDREGVSRTLTENVAEVDETFSALVRHKQPPSKVIVAAADASSSWNARTVYLICAVCSLACHVSHPAPKGVEKPYLNKKENILVDNRPEHLTQSSIADAPRMDLLLKCLTLLTTAIDCLEPSDVAAVRRAKRALALISVESRSTSSCFGAVGVLPAVTTVPGHESHVDLNEKFEKVAESLMDADQLQSTRNRLDTPEGRTLKKMKTTGSAATPTEQDQDRMGPGPRATASKEMGSSGPRVIASSSRSHSGVKSYVTFAEHGHTTPVGGVRSRGNSVDGDAAPPSTNTTDNWSTARRLPRVRGTVESTGDGTYRAMPLSLSALHMPGVDRAILTATYNSISMAANTEGQDRSLPLSLPLEQSTLESIPLELSCSDSTVALLPGNLVELLLNLAALFKSLCVPTHALYPSEGLGLQHCGGRSVADTATSPANPPAGDRRMELLQKIVDLIQTVFRGIHIFHD
jgi:hypothetical protein